MATACPTVGSPAARRFAGISELLWMVGELLVGDQSSLAKLCLVSRGFHQVLWPFLYRVVLLEQTPSPFKMTGDSSSGLAMFTKFTTTKVLHVQFSKIKGGTTSRIPRMTALNKFVASLLQHMKNVEVIRLHGVTIAHSCLNHLTSNLNLKDLHLAFFDSVLNPNVPVPFHLPDRLRYLRPTSPFNSLRKLTLEDLDFHQQYLMSIYVATMLAQTPNLEHLRLSVLPRHCTEILVNICTEYQKSCGVPLRLKSLFLGKSMHMIEHMLSCLVDVSFLERAQVGGDCVFCGHNAAASLSLFTPTKTPKMQQLEIFEIEGTNWSVVDLAVEGMKALKVQQLRGPAISLCNMAHRGKIQMLRVPFYESNGRRGSWFFQELSLCDFLTHLKLVVKDTVCDWYCCLPSICEAMPHLPNLTAFNLAPCSGALLSNCHGKKETRSAALALMAFCTELEYIELYGVAYEATWPEADSESPEKTWKLLSEAEKQIRQPEFFVEDEFLVRSASGCGRVPPRRDWFA